MAVLVATFPDGRTARFALAEHPQTLGRDPSCELWLEDPSVSRRHAQIVMDEGRFVLADMGSKNGTLVNEQRVDRKPLNHLDDILIGSVELRFLAEGGSTEQPSSVVVAEDTVARETASYQARDDALHLTERRLQILYDISERLTTLRDRDALLEDALTVCFESLRFERGAIALRKRTGRGVEWPVVRNLRGAGGELTISRTLLGRALDHGERAIVTDASAQPVDPTISMVQHGIRSAMCVPLMHESRVLGVIYGDRVTTGTVYAKEDVDFFAGIARQVTIGLINAQLMEEQKFRLELEKELDVAREIQEGLFPQALPQRDGVRVEALNEPGRTVSGDYYDVIELPDGRIGFLIADVTGKGVASSLLMSNLQAAVRLSLVDSDDLGRTVGRWNHLLFANTDAMKFVTCLAGVFDPREQTLTFCTAGHPLPYILAADSPPRLLTAPADFPLGVVGDATYTPHTVQLDARPCVVFCYTDGVTEAMNAEDELFGEHRVEQALADCREMDPGAVIRRMRRAIAQHCRDAPQSDDITMLTIGVT